MSIAIEKQLDYFAVNLSTVMKQLEKNLLNVIGTAATDAQLFDAVALLNSQPAMIEALRDAGYFALADQHVSTFEKIPAHVTDAFKKRGLPAPKFSTVDKANMTALAQMDLDQFNNIGVAAMNELRLLQVQNAVAGASFDMQVEAIKAATVGVGKNGAPLANHAYTHANTSILNFQGETLIKAGESLGHDKESDMWEVVGVLDGKTRQECQDALANPIRTKGSWQNINYWGGTPGSFNCRHQLFPYFGEV